MSNNQDDYSLPEMVFDDLEYDDYSSIILGGLKDQIKLYIDWFVVKYYPLITKRCRLATICNGNVVNKGDFEDLRSQCIIEAYAIGERYDVMKGDLLKFLLSSLWFFPFRNSNQRNIRTEAYGQFGADVVSNKLACELIDTPVKYSRNFREDAIRDVNSIQDTAICSSVSVDYESLTLDKMIAPLQPDQKLLMQLKYGCSMTNVAIAEYLGANESTIRYWLGAANKRILNNTTPGIGID